jgi:DNA polymerase III epsilon subunit-like protein
MTTSIILDFETLATEPDATVIQIGAIAVIRQDFTIIERLNIHPEIFGQLADGRSFDRDTILWHQKKGTHIQNGRTPIREATAELQAFIERHNSYRIWAWGKDFERPLYENLCRTLGLPIPDYQFRKFACARDAWQNAFGLDHKAPDRTHDALKDCEDELRDLHAALKKTNLLHVF